MFLRTTARTSRVAEHRLGRWSLSGFVLVRSMSCLQSKSSVSPSSSSAARAAGACAPPRSTACRSRSPGASASPCSGATARASRPSCASCRRCCSTTGAARGVFGHDVVRDERKVRGLVNRVSVEAAFFKRLSAAENLSYAARFYGLTPAYTRRRIPEILAAVGFPARRATAPMEDLSRGMQQKVALARALHDLADAAAARRADDRPRPARQARGAGLHRRDAPHARHHHAAVHARHGRGRGAGRPRRDPRRADGCWRSTRRPG